MSRWHAPTKGIKPRPDAHSDPLWLEFDEDVYVQRSDDFFQAVGKARAEDSQLDEPFQLNDGLANVG